MPGAVVPLCWGLPFPFMNPLPFITPLLLPLDFPLPSTLPIDEALPLPFDLPFELLPFEVGVYDAWYGPGDTKLEAGSCKYDHARWLGCEVFCRLAFPFPPLDD